MGTPSSKGVPCLVSCLAILPCCEQQPHHKVRPVPLLQGSVVIVYNWIASYTAEQISPHSWITGYMKDLALPVSFVGTSTDDSRHILPQKEVSALPCLALPCPALPCYFFTPLLWVGLRCLMHPAWSARHAIATSKKL